MKTQSKMHRVFVLSLATAASNFAVPRGVEVARQTPPPKSTEFSLTMVVGGTNVSLTAVSNGTDDLVLQAEKLSVFPGTLGTATYRALWCNSINVLYEVFIVGRVI